MASTPKTQSARTAETVPLDIEEKMTKPCKKSMDQHQQEHQEKEYENTKTPSCGSRLSICVGSCCPSQTIRHVFIKAHSAPADEIFVDDNAPKSVRNTALSHLPTHQLNLRPTVSTIKEEEEEEEDQKNISVIPNQRALKRDLQPQREELFVSRLSIRIQLAFRQNILRLLTNHVVLVSCGIALTVFVLHDGFDIEKTDRNKLVFEILLASGFLMMTIVLCFLYVIRFEHPSNMLLLTFFTFFEMFFFIVLSMFLRFQSVLFVCTLTVCSVVLNFAMATYQRCNDTTKEHSLFSAFTCSCLSMIIVTIIAVSAFLMLGEEHGGLTVSNVIGCLGFVSLLNGWMGFSTHYMYESMTPDEYVYALVFFYTDLIAILLLPLLKLWKCLSKQTKSSSGTSGSTEEISEITIISTNTRERVASNALSPTSAAARRRSLIIEEEFNKAIDVEPKLYNV